MQGWWMNMKTWMGGLAKAALAAVAVLASTAAGGIWYLNRDVPEPTLAEKQQSYRRAVAWIQTNEASVLKDGNSALWWMVQSAAERTGDDYLKSLVQQWTAQAYTGTSATVPWKRIVHPQADITLNMFSLQGFEPYQQFFYHAVTCQPVSLDKGGDTSEFLDAGICRPVATQVYAGDAVCSTHQLMGLKLMQRVGCPTQVDLPKLESGLLADIDQQMRWDVMFKDAYIQRVLMLRWVGGPEQVKPIWLRRVLTAQQADGGWVSGRHVPEMPDWLQPWRLGSARTAPTNFHATAQGLLIAALAITEKPR